MSVDYYKRIVLNYLREPERVRYEIDSARRRRAVRRAHLPRLVRRAADGELPICVSLTSYGQRIQKVHLALRSIMDQTVRPNRVVLWLGEDAHNVELPRSLTQLEELGVEIRRDVEDLKGHKKYYFAMQELSDCLLITIDDDLLFPRDTIESLLRAHARVPRCVVARRTHRIAVSGNEVASYDQWQREFEEQAPVPRKSLLATTGAGTLYPPHTFERLVGSRDDIRRYALDADDLWIKAMEVRAGIRVAYAPNSRPMPFINPFTQQESYLAVSNVAGGGNDRTMRALIDHFGFTADDFEDEDG